MNMCVAGRLVPEFFLLGAQKAGTTSFARMFYRSPGISGDSKEIHKFDTETMFNSTGGWGEYLTRFPPCQQRTRQVSADCTPNYLYSPDNFAAKKINELYGSSESAIKRLKFLVILREPAKRMYSAYNHGVRNNWRSGEYDVNFETLAQLVLRSPENHSFRSFSHSLYAKQISAWFEVFSPSQFTVALMQHFVLPEASGLGSRRLHREMWSALGVPAPKKGKDPDNPLNENAHHQNPYAPLEKVVLPETLERLRALFDSSTGPDVLTDLLHGSGARLWGCEGCNTTSTAHWIRTGW